MSVSSWVESVEFVDAYLDSSSTTVSYDLTKGQNYENCVPFFTAYGNADYWDSRLCDVNFSGTTESGIINFGRYNTRSMSVGIKCYVVEFNPEEVRVQQGSFGLASGVNSQTVTLPTTLSGTNRAAMTFGWAASSSEQRSRRLFVRGRVVTDTSIDFYRGDSGNSCWGHWFIFEDLADNFRVRHLGSGFAGSSQTIAVEGNRCVDPLRTFLLGSYASTSVYTEYATRWSTRIYLLNDGAVRADKNDADYDTIYWSAQVVEILDKTKVYTPFDIVHTGFTSTTSWVRTVGGTIGRVPFLCNPETTSIAVAAMQGITRGEGIVAAQISDLMVAAELTASGTITYYKGSATYASNLSYTMAVDWAGIDVDTGTNDNIIPEGTGPGQSFVKSVENFRFGIVDYFGAYVLTKGQDWKNCVVFASIRGTDGTYVQYNMANIYIVEPGIVCFRNRANSTVYVDVSVVEFWPNQIKVQHKNVYSHANTTSNFTIEEISNTNKAFILSKVFSTANNSYQPRYSFSRVRFTSTTNIEDYMNVGSYHDLSYFVVEDLQDNFIVYHSAVTWAGGSQTFYNNSFHSGIHNTMVIHTFASAGTDNYSTRNFCRAYFADEFRPIYADKADSAYYNIYSNFTVVKFLSNKRVSHLTTYTLGVGVTTINSIYTADFEEHPHAISVFPVNQLSSHRVDTTDNAGVKGAFVSIRITDYVNRTIEISTTNGSYNTYGGYQIIDWIGCHYQDQYGYTGVPTRSLIKSLQKRQYTGITGTILEPLKYGQDVNKCVPFFNWSFHTAVDPVRDTVAIYRYDNPDFFTVRFGAGGTGNRYTMLYIVEFNNDIKVQHGHCYGTGTSANVTIEEVNLDRAFLHFYSLGDDWGDYNRSLAVCGRFLNSTTLQFNRAYSTGSMQISWYVVECPEQGEDSHWKVQRSYLTGLGGGGTVSTTLEYNINTGRTLFFSSWSTTNSDYPNRGVYRMYQRSHNIWFDKQDSSYWDMNHLNVEAVDFNKRWELKGFKVCSDFVTVGGTVPLAQYLNDSPESPFFVPRSMIINGNENNNSRVDTTITAGYKEAGIYHEFIDLDDNDYSYTINSYKGGTSYTTRGFYYAVQWPVFNKYYLEGYTKEQGDPVAREVIAYRTSTGEFVDRITSISGTGYFYLETPYYDAHHVVCLDDESGPSYNHLIYGKVYPTVISGSFAYYMGITNNSGISGEGVPDWEVYE